MESDEAAANGDTATGVVEPAALPDGHGYCQISGAVCKIWQPYRIQLPWPTELVHRRVGTRLGGIEVYYDFHWVNKFGHGRGTFRNGENLARFVRKECPADKTAALVLTTRADVVCLSFDWNARYVVVVNINEYRAFSAANPAIDFFASRFKGRLSRIVDIEESAIAAWAANDPERIKKLAEMAQRLGGVNGSTAPATPDDVRRVFEAVGRIDGSLVDLVFDLLYKGGVEADYLLKLVLESGQVDDFADALEWLLQSENREIVKHLAKLQGDSLKKLATLSSLAALSNALTIWESNRANGDEEFWQRTLQQHSFILNQIFAFPIVLIKGKAYVGGKSIENTSGNIADFLCANARTHNVAFVEIKTPLAGLLTKTLYRGDAYNIGPEISGATIQVATQRDAFVKECNSLLANRDTPLYAFSPKCVVIAGDTSQFTEPRQIKSFELYRSALTGIEVITFDELFDRIRSFIEILGSDKTPPAAAPVESDFGLNDI